MTKATVRANARTTPKATKRRAGKRKAKSGPRAKLDDHPVARLPFVASRDGRTLLLPKGDESPRCFWHVQSTGDYMADEVMGEKFALEYLAHQEKDSMSILQHIVIDMPRKLGPIEISFLTMVAYAAGAGRKRAEEVSAYWARCWQERART